jgi:kumamolisin
MTVDAYALLEGSHHTSLPASVSIGPVWGDQTYQVTILLRRRPDAPPFPDPQETGRTPIADRRYLTIEDLETTYGASQDDADEVIKFAQRFGLQVHSADLGRRTVALSGRAAQFSAAFKAQLHLFAYHGGVYRGYAGGLQVPETLADSILSITGLDERPVTTAPRIPARGTSGQIAAAAATANARTAAHLLESLPEYNKALRDALHGNRSVKEFVEAHERLQRELAGKPSPDAAVSYTDKIAEPHRRALETLREIIGEHISTLNHKVTETARQQALVAIEMVGIKTAPQIADLYNFPAGTDGSGECIGIIELGGGYYRSDLEAYLKFLGLPEVDISDVEVDGGRNLPGVVEPYDVEVALDIQVIAGAAPGAKLVLYFAPLQARGFIDAVQAALHDKTSRPRVLSISWDLSEGFWLGAPMHVRHFEEILTEAAALGVTILCSAGDYGSATTFHDGQLWVDYPASSPLTIGCGGTTLSSIRDQILDETVWNTFSTFGQATGGGFSKIFPRPHWQAPFTPHVRGGEGRGVPDMAGNADPSTGYLLEVHGGMTVIGGTSAIAPLFSALIARINQSLGKPVGYINPLIYTADDREAAFYDVVSGSNDTYRAGAGWDPCTGLGRPIGAGLRDLLRDAGRTSNRKSRDGGGLDR